MNKKPQHIGFGEVRNVINNISGSDNDIPFLSDEIVMVNDSSALFSKAFELNTPYIIEDIRLGMVVDGEGVIDVNLMEHHVKKGVISFINYGDIITPRNITSNFKIRGVMMKRGLAERVFEKSRMGHMIANTTTGFVTCPEKELAMISMFFDNMWQVLKNYGFREDLVEPGLIQIVNMYGNVLNEMEQKHNRTISHSNRLFKQFIRLVNQHCEKEHNIDFYAGELCLTAHHLGLVVKAESGVTAKEWIDRALITKAKVMLKNSDMQMSQISDQLAFANASFFSKYFKRLTGMTPQEYKKL